MPTEKIKNLANEKMDSILRAAVREFADFAYDDASYNRIIKKAGLGKGTMYYYFKSKEDLFVTIVKAIEQGFCEAATKGATLPDPGGAESLPGAREPDISSADYWQEIEAKIKNVLVFARQQPLIFRLAKRNFLQQAPAKAGPGAQVAERLEAWLLALLSRGQKAGYVREDLSQTLVRGILWSHLQTVAGWFDGVPEESPEAAASLAVDLLRRQLAV